MGELRQELRAYLEMQQDLGMPDLIFEPGFIQTAPLFSPAAAAITPVVTPAKKLPALPAATSRPAQAVAAAPMSAARTRRAAPASNFGSVDLEPVAPPVQKQADTPKREELKKLFFATRECRNCELCQSRRNVVFGSGSADATVMVIGEAPDAEEDEQGNPSVGGAGKLLTDMLTAIRLDRKQNVFITNVVKCRPPQDRKPGKSELGACRTILQQQIAIIRPQVILLMGRTAAQAVFETTESINHLRTVEHTFEGVPTIVTYHPAALLRSPEYKRPAWEDLQKLEKILGENRKSTKQE